MRRWVVAWAAAAAVTLGLSGCRTSISLPYAREIDQMSLMQAMAVDAQDGGGVLITASSGGQQGSEGAGTPAAVVYGRGETVSGGVLAAQGAGESYLYFGHVGQLLLGQPLAEQGISAVLEYVLRDVEMRLDTRVYLTREGQAGQAVAAAAQNGSAADRLEAMEENAGLLPHTMPRTVEQVLEDLARSGSSFVPAVTADGELAADGYGVFKEGALVGWARGEAAYGVNLLLEQVEADVVEVVRSDGTTAAVRVVGAVTSVRPVWRNEELTGLEIACRVQANLIQGEAENLEELEQALARIEAARIRQALNVSQALEADYLQLEQAACLAQLWNKKAIGQQFELPALELSLEVDAQIGRSYDAR